MDHYFLTTERLNFRAVCLEDAAFILKLVNQASFKTNIGDKGVTDLFSAQEHIHTSYLSQYEKLGFEIICKGILVGGYPFASKLLHFG